jgi:predicted nucleotidyltransferase
MSNIYRINFKQLRQENLKEIFDAFERALQIPDIDFYLIGALARDTWFAQKGIRALGTKDVDFAVMISNPEKYLELKQYLVSEENFTESSTNEYVLFDKKGFQIDLLPFGSLEIEGEQIIDKEGLVRTDISGFREVYEEATQEVSFENKYKFKVSTLAGIVILKFISYDDRPEMRAQDIKDIASILMHYFELETEAIYEHHANLFTDENDDLNKIAARVLGRQMQKVLNKIELLKDRILSLLKKNTVSSVDSTIALLMQTGNDTIENNVELLKEILKGATETYD